MKITRIFFVAAIAYAFIVGCSGNLGKFKKKSGEDNAATVQEFKNNLVDYDVYHCPWINRHNQRTLADHNLQISV